MQCTRRQAAGAGALVMAQLGLMLQTAAAMGAPPVLPAQRTGPSPDASDASAPRQLDSSLPAPTAGAAAASPRRRVLSASWTFRRVTAPSRPPEPWLPAVVPGTVHTDLLANRKIADPFYRLNEKDQQWIERESWEYRTSVVVDEALLRHERVELVFAGLDTYAEVSLNGVSVLSATNMFRTWRVDVKKVLRPGDNVLLVQFRSPIARVKAAYDHLGYRLPAVNDQAAEMVSMFSRKAPYHFGWDWGPRLVTSGIWRPVELQAWNSARLDDVHIIQEQLGAQAALLRVKAGVQAARAGRVTVSVTVSTAAAPVVAAQVVADLKVGHNVVAVPVRIDNPQRWWPNGLGAQHLYTFDTTVTNDIGERDQRRTRFGLRTIEVVHERDKDGKSFTIKVNGAPVFMKGANWVPADSFLPRITEDRYRWLLRSAAATHMNMIRVWGGGVYEEDLFYELCDELGLLVWQDFMFACSMYPGDDAFVENVRREAIDNVRRLRNHASLALWAGNNEIEAAWLNWGWAAKFQLSRPVQDKLWADYRKMFHQVLPAVVAAEDPGRFYTRSSPSANDDSIPANKLGMGDMHYWGVWHAEEPYTRYAANTSRFMSEYGFQSFPELGTVARYTIPGDWNVEGPVMLAHQRHPRGNQLIRTYMDRDFRRPKDFASFLYVGQVLQATVIQYAAEAHRRRMGHNWGSLYWQLDDCWPVASWSSIDYFGRWKALHHAAKRFFAPVLVSAVEEGGNVNIWAISDHRSNTAARLTVRLIDLAGKELWRRQQDVRLAPNSSRVHLTLSRKESLAGANPAAVILVAELTDLAAAGKRLSRSVMSFVKTKELQLPRPELRLEAESPGAEGRFAVKVSARKFARAVYLTSPVEGFFEDNYFDLLPGETSTVWFHASGQAAGSAPPVQARSIVDSY